MAIVGKGRKQPRKGRVRPKKPYPDFPLFPHLTGRWAKKIRGRFVFFGPWEDPQGALTRFLADRDHLYSGLVHRPPTADGAPPSPPPANGNGHDAAGPTVRDLVNHFLTAKQRRVDAGDMGRRAFSDYHTACRYLVEGLGLHRLLSDLTPGDFGAFRAKLAKTRGPVALGNQINKVRSVFKYAYDAAIIDKPIRFGPEFVRPPMRAVRLAKRAKGARLFEREEIQTLLKAADPALKAMIHLGVNCGLGNTDISELSLSMMDLKTGVLDFPRPKTGIARRCFLWPETVMAIRTYLMQRKEPVSEDDADILFITKYGKRWVRVKDPGPQSKGKTKAVPTDAVGLQFGKLTRATKTYRDGRSFYALRHTFRTVADEVGDRRAVDLVMGHEPGGDIATQYVERISDERLEKVARRVRTWLFGGKK